MESIGKLSTRVVEHLRDPLVKSAVRVKSSIMGEAGKFLRGKEFVELLPTIISPITDPLNHEVHNAKFRYYDQEYRLTQSMIFHKQLACKTFDRIFIVSPNVRLETSEKALSGRHLFEFSQIDLEIRNAKRDDVMTLVEDLITTLIVEVKSSCKEELELLSSNPSIPTTPFTKVKFMDAYEQYGKDFETVLSSSFKEPFWLIDFPIWEREFYDLLSQDGRTLKDMDLILPNGFGETLSGGEREWEYQRIISRMEFKGNDPEELAWYMEIAEAGELVPTAGCGIGVERLTRYICSLDNVASSSGGTRTPNRPVNSRMLCH
ncbi:MAG: Aspartyl/asparaginyl-tRNA synthetase [Mesotoga infera]|uniref:Aspartyl/asparaginyl-tRNA synthetase n=1 Tax=Mesotoga infera TaxID=1236046 RepID=A0A101I9S6_9BACT|nr:MAG: Aspartyl/asparaginyl-tRNA synthetase [Mesotoga infera]